MPLVDDDGNEIDLDIPWVLQSEIQQQRTLVELETYRDELEDDMGPFTTQPLSTGRVLVRPRGEEPLVAYMSDEGPDARVVIDDITAELWPAWQGYPDAQSENPSGAPSVRLPGADDAGGGTPPPNS